MKIHRGRAANLFLGYAEHFRGDFSALETEHDNILSGADFANIAESWKMVERFAWTIDPYLRTRGYWKNLRTILENFTNAANKLGDKSGVAFSLAQLALLEDKLGNIKCAIELTTQAETIFKEIGANHHVEKARRQKEWLKGKMA